MVKDVYELKLHTNLDSYIHTFKNPLNTSIFFGNSQLTASFFCYNKYFKFQFVQSYFILTNAENLTFTIKEIGTYRYQRPLKKIRGPYVQQTNFDKAFSFEKKRIEFWRFRVGLDHSWAYEL